MDAEVTFRQTFFRNGPLSNPLMTDSRILHKWNIQDIGLLIILLPVS